uniref:Uncharacterized protein n=1 Tax=Triticum urartu TaxID=4572 RepID=A0A8R7QPS1_TRIUA
MADLMAAGDQVGCAFLISTATPLMCGVDMDVPDMMSNLYAISLGGWASPLGMGTAAMMFTPGPVMSGLRIPWFCLLGPRDENGATTGAMRLPSNAPLKTSWAVGLCVEFTYAMILSDHLDSTCVAGRACALGEITKPDSSG